jgi:alpha-glucoside transport system substrate-binding protein
MSKKTNWTIVSVIVVLAMVLASCAPAPTAAPTAVPTVAPTTPPVAGDVGTGTPVIPGGALEQALTGKFKGTTVVMDGPFSSDDQVKFED